MSDDSQSARIARLEAMSVHYGEMLERITRAVEESAKFNGTVTSHIELSKRLWDVVENHSKQLADLQTISAKNCEFCNQSRHVFWWVMGVLSLGLAYIVKYFVENHGR